MRLTANHWNGAGAAARAYLFRLVSVFLLLSGLGAGVAVAQESLCAEVKIVIEQKLSLERQAFDAHLAITNGLDAASLQNVAIELNFKDRNDQPVVATSDPNAAGASFFTRVDSMTGLAALDGSASIGPKALADIHWLIIPAAGTGGSDPTGKLYYVGAKVTYTLNGQVSVVDVTPDYVIVKPQPLLKLDYFLPRDVYADDPFTPEVEPQEPFTLGVRIGNVGGGSALKTRIESAQPKIVENKQGLLIDFQILGGYVSDNPAGKSLMLDFGAIAPGKAKVGRWSMVTTLAGRFVEFGAEYSHADNLGGAATSLVQKIDTHTLLRDVRVDLPGRDAIRDFLAKDVDVIRVYESDGVDGEVVDQSGSAALRANGASWELKFQPVQGFVYARVSDPFGGAKVLGQVLRSDGKPVPAENVWLSKTRNGDLSWSYFINLFDSNTTGAYAIGFVDAATATLSGVAYKDLNANGLRDAGEPGLGTLAVTLKGVDDRGVNVSGTAYADAAGAFSFARLDPGRYQLESAAVDGLIDGVWLAGSAGGRAKPGQIADIQLAAGANAQGYLLAKRAGTAGGTKERADLSLRLSASPATLRKGDTVAFTLLAANAGPSAVADASVAMALPEGFVVQSSVAGKGTYLSGAWRIGSLGSGESATLTVTAKANTLADSTTVAAQIGSTTEDPLPSNNGASALLKRSGSDVGASQSLLREPRMLVLASCLDAQGKADSACAEAKASFMQGYLTAHGYPATAYATAGQALKALRSGGYNGIWLNAAGLEAGDPLLGEVREAVRRGNMLVVDGTSLDRLARLADVMGAAPGAIVAGESLEVLFNDGTPSIALPKGAVRALQLAGAGELARVSSAGANVGVAARNGFGRGKALVAGFDLATALKQAAQKPAVGAFLKRQLDEMLPALAEPALARAYLAIETVLDNRGDNPVDTRLTTELPPDMSASDSLPAPASAAGRQLVWEKTLASAETQKVRLGVRLPKASGAATVHSALVRRDDGGALGDFPLTVEVLGADVLIPRVVSALDALSGADQATADRIARARGLAGEARTAFGANDHELAIGKLIDLQDLLKPPMALDIENLRLDIAGWVGIAEAYWQEGSGAGGVAASIAASGGAAQAATVGQAFPAVLQATVLDAGGKGVAGAEVVFRLPSSGPAAAFPNGALFVASRTDADGVARSPMLTANSLPGSYAAEASVAGVAASARFSLENRAAAPLAAAIETLSGTPQAVAVGKNFAALKALVRDGAGAPLPGATVTFRAPSAGPSASFLGVEKTVAVTSDSAGVAASPILTANATVGEYQVTASVDGVQQAAVFKLANTEDPDSVLTLARLGGSGQASVINTAFAEPLAVQVSNRDNLPRGGVVVRFALPESGPSARFAGGGRLAEITTGSDGIARSPLLTANALGGRYSAQASAEKGSAALAFDLLNLTPGSDGKNFSGVTATGTGSMQASISGGGAGCVFKPDSTRLLASAQVQGAFRNMRFPHGVFEYGLYGCVPGSRITVTSVWPSFTARPGYRNFGPTPASGGKAGGYIPNDLQVDGRTIIHSVIDGQLGDDDLSANGQVHGVGGPTLPKGATGGWLWLLLD